MSGLASASTPTSTFSSIQQSNIQSRRYINPRNSVVIPITQLCSSDLTLKSCTFGVPRVPQRRTIICRSSTGPGAPGSGVVSLFVSFTEYPLLHIFGVKLKNMMWHLGFQNHVFGFFYFLFFWVRFPEFYASRTLI